jgi:hypothetical protein
MTEPASDEPRAAWVSIAAPPGGGTHMRLRDADGRVVVDAVYVHGPEITATTLQAVPVSHLALIANLMPGIALFDILTAIKFGGYDYPVTEELASSGEPSLADLRAHAEGAPAEFVLVERIERGPLTRPDGTDPDGFSARVAEAYREYAMRTRAPAVEIAAEAGVPVATARSWIREARRRGKLPPGRKGKAG